jgi:phosphonate transport system substrate-binding protein
MAAVLAAGVLLTACGGGGGGEAAPAPERLVLGLVPSDEVDQLVTDAEALGGLLSAELGIPVETFVSDSYAALVVAMQSGQADVGLFGPIALVQSVDQAGAVPILQSVRRGTSTYHTQWMTNDPARFCTTPVVEAPDSEGRVFSYCNGTDAADTGPIGEEALRSIRRASRSPSSTRARRRATTTRQPSSSRSPASIRSPASTRSSPAGTRTRCSTSPAGTSPSA